MCIHPDVAPEEKEMFPRNVLSLLTAAMLLALLFMSGPFQPTNDVEAKQSTPDGGGYKYTDGNKPEPTIKAQYIPIKNNPKAIGLDTPNWGAEVFSVNLGFNFEYYGQTYSKINVCDYGAMSFTETTASSFENYWSYSIPSTARPLGLMAVYWTFDGCQTTAKDRLYVLQTQLDGEKALIVEWNCNNGGVYEAILYESGMILFQYQSVQSWYRVGEYCVIGIESPDSTMGTSYQNWKWPAIRHSVHEGDRDRDRDQTGQRLRQRGEDRVCRGNGLPVLRRCFSH